MKKRILCFGDSNTWGFMPGVGTRFSEDKRWTGVLACLLGDGCTVLEDGLNGRTTVFDDPFADFRNGKRGLGYALESRAPLDMVVLCLGTNDLKFTDAIGSYKGVEELLRRLDNADGCSPVGGGSGVFAEGTKVLVVSPITLHPRIDEIAPDGLCRGKYEESLKFARYCKMAAEAHRAGFLDAAEYASPSETDGVHMDEASHLALGEAVAAAVKEMLGLPA